MSYTRTQIYLDAEDHRRLSERARKEGKSLTSLLREVVKRYLRGAPASGRPRGFDAIVSVVTDGEHTDVAALEREYLARARATRAKKKLGR